MAKREHIEERFAQRVKATGLDLRQILEQARRRSRTTWLVLERGKDDAYRVAGTSDACPGDTFFTKNIGAIMVEEEGGAVKRCHAEGWVSHDRKLAYVRYQDFGRGTDDLVIAQDRATVEVTSVD